MLLPALNHSLDELVVILNQLSDEEYASKCQSLSDASIGEHTRHIIEMLQCLEKYYESGIVDYDLRERNKTTQTSTAYAIECIENIQKNIDKPNKKIELQQIIEGQEIRIDSNYHRELLYNLEHCIHHQALIKVAVLQCENIEIDPNFGVARSTIEYRKQCAQ